MSVKERLIQATDFTKQSSDQMEAAMETLDTAEPGSADWYQAKDQLEIGIPESELLQKKLESLVEEAKLYVAGLKKDMGD